MKCYHCGKTISRNHPYCEYCGALVKPTPALIAECRNGKKKAIAQLYKISYLKIYTELLIVGVGREEGKRLMNRAFRKLLKELATFDDLDQFDHLIRIVSRKVGRSYLEHFHLEPLEQPYEDVYFKVTDEMIDDLFEYLQKRKPVTKIRKKTKRKFFQFTKQNLKHLGILLAVILVLGTITGLIKVKNDASNNERRIVTYVSVVKQYQKGVKAVNKSNDTTSLTTSYPLCSDAINMAYSNSVKSANLRAAIIDVDGDGHDDLVLGYVSKNKMVITGIYMNNDLNTKATNTHVLTGSETLILTKDHQLIRNEGDTYHLLSLNGKDQYIEKTIITDLNTYLDECGTSVWNVTGLTTSKFISQYAKNDK